MTLSLEAAIRLVKSREAELQHAGWNPSPAEIAAQRVVAEHAWLWRRFELAFPDEAKQFQAGVDISIELRGKG